MDTNPSSRKRSRSPTKSSHNDPKRHRSRSPHRKHHHHHHKSHSSSEPARKLPFRQQPLTKHSFESYKPLFAEYLDVQKRLNIDELEEHEVKGRWKSFLKKWNAGELSEGWYEPEMKERVDGRWGDRPKFERAALPVREEEEEDGEEDGYGPSLPGRRGVGPAIPTLDDLQHRNEAIQEDRSNQMADLRFERKVDRSLQKERLDEALPRADPGSRERQLEKKRDTAAVNREFRDAKDSGEVEVGESELMGDEGGVESFKAKLKVQEKVKNEREVRKEEVLRARMAEREERLEAHRRKEEKTMEKLREIARQRFG